MFVYSKTAKKTIVYLSILCLATVGLPVRAANSFPPHAASQDPQQIVGPTSRPLTSAQLKYIQGRIKMLNTIRAVLSDSGAPFNPDLLMSRDWRRRLKTTFAAMPQMQITRLQNQPLKGAVFANELQLSDNVTIASDTVIVANRITFRKSNSVIKGPHNIHIFVVDYFGPEVTGSNSVTVDTSGIGRKEWLATNGGKAPRAKGWNAGSLYMASDNTSGAPGAKGTDGTFGQRGIDGEGGANGPDGACAGSPNGVEGLFGGSGGDGNDGGNAGDGSPGGDAQDISLNITDPNDSTSYNLIAKGGDGGDGGDGGSGGIGGTGGKGGNGGNGVACNCASGGIGAGGNGGNGGRGGRGGSAGNGGKGAQGGKGGNITVSYPSGYDIDRVSADASGGNSGRGGSGGIGGTGGLGGDPGAGGAPGSILNCGTGNAGQNGNYGNPGDSGSSGNAGQPGTPGNAGNVTYNQTGGGSGGPDLEPGGNGGGGGSGGGCTEWWWVWYEWSCEIGFYNGPSRKSRLSTSISEISASNAVATDSLRGKTWLASASPLFSTAIMVENCGWRESGRMYAGCW